MTDRTRQADDQPDLDPPARRRADRPLQQPAGERAVDRGPAGAGRGDRRGGSRRQREGGGHRLRGPDLLRRRRHHRVRQAAAAAVAAAGRRHDRELLQAGRCGDPRHRARRRARGRARLPLSRRRSRPRSWARPRSSSACCRAPAGRSGCRASPASARRSKCARPAIRSAPRRRSTAAWSTGWSRASSSRTRSLMPRRCATSGRCPNRPSGRTGSPTCDPDSVRRVPQGQRPKVPRLRSAAEEYRGGQGRDRKALSPKA